MGEEKPRNDFWANLIPISNKECLSFFHVENVRVNGIVPQESAARLEAMSLADPEAAFELHGNKLVPDGSLVTLLSDNGIKSLSALAFSAGTPTVTAPTDEQFAEFATRLNGGNPMSFGVQAALQEIALRSVSNSHGRLESTCNRYFWGWD